MEYQWPGNVRELENVMERAMILGVSEGIVEPINLPENFHSILDNNLEFGEASVSLVNLDGAVNAFMKRHIRRTLDTVQNDKKEAARLLGLSLSSLYRKLEDLGISLKVSENDR